MLVGILAKDNPSNSLSPLGWLSLLPALPLPEIMTHQVSSGSLTSLTFFSGCPSELCGSWLHNVQQPSRTSPCSSLLLCSLLCHVLPASLCTLLYTNLCGSAILAISLISSLLVIYNVLVLQKVAGHVRYRLILIG